ncbi:hypothetical protein BE04_32605 [Sorangium cellulosum]|uniref:Uncharacterized protein n=1 Tax=Sorangium cellulosum TaxID=56 RepID=A0A150P4H4_SORCE|nr:hypothetical protein BE04_32605 [Sorangium cellulosum]
MPGSASTLSRYIVWREYAGARPIVGILADFPEIQILRREDSDAVVVMMTEASAQKVRRAHPGLHVERDIAHRRVGGFAR